MTQAGSVLPVDMRGHTDMRRVIIVTALAALSGCADPMLPNDQASAFIACHRPGA